MGQADWNISSRELQIISIGEPECIHSGSASRFVGPQNSSVLQRE